MPTLVKAHPQIGASAEEQARAIAFTNELEAISRRYKIWIRSPVPAMQPCLAEGYDDEDGYTLTCHEGSPTITINRRLK